MIDAVIKEYIRSFETEPELVVLAPGRINLIGEHTDYNLGYVLPAAINRYIAFAIGRSTSSRSKIHALDIEDSLSLSIENLKEKPKLWQNYIVGVLDQVKKRGLALENFNCVFGGNIPIGSGLSSSAALDCGFIKSLSELFGYDLDKWSIVEISNHSNNQFLGIQSGILDQFSSVFGKENHCIFLDCQSKQYEYHKITLEPYEIVLIDSKVKHEHSSSGYNNRPEECKKLVQMLSSHYKEVSTMRDINMAMLKKHRKLITEKLFNRGRFILEENSRVIEFAKNLKINDLNKLGELLYESHNGLTNLYEVSCSEMDLLVDLTRSEQHIIGSRMMGGGFGGCTINLIHGDHKTEVIERVLNDYKKASGITGQVYELEISEGVQRVKQ